MSAIRNTSKPRLWSLLAVVLLAIIPFGCGDGIPSSPDQAVLRAVNGFAENKPVAAWEFLPTSYQKDVNDIVRDVIGKVDPEMWNETAKTAQRIVKILREKKTFILAKMPKDDPKAPKGGGLSNPFMTMMQPAVDQHYDKVVGILEAIVTSELATHEGAMKIDVGAFADRTLGRIMADINTLLDTLGKNTKGEAEGEMNEYFELYDKLKKLKATIVEQKDDTAKVKIEVPGEKTEELEFVRVEGKWIPKDFSTAWADGVKEMREQIKNNISKDDIKEIKDMLMPKLDDLNLVLDKLEKASTQEEFDRGIGSLGRMIESWMQNSGGGF